MENQKIKARIAHFVEYGKTLPKAKVYYREDWQTYYFDLFGKQFGMMSPDPDEKALITLKNDPLINDELRELYPGIITPGYYANKKHWNSILLKTSEITDEEIEKMIEKSYQLVAKNLTKAQKAELAE